MYCAPVSTLGSFGSFLKKFRKIVHNTMPRELSPTRLLEKMGVDQKKKGDAKIATIKTKTAADAAAFDAQQATVKKQLAALNSPAIPTAAPIATSAPATDNTMLYAGVAALAIGAALLLRRKHRK